MSEIFISYRRSDSTEIVDRIYERLKLRFDQSRIFRDMHSIAYGADFADVIRKQVAQARVMLVIMGPTWSSVSETGPRGGKRKRLDNQKDFVRIEVETALRLPSVLVIPILVKGAALPKISDLPPSLHELLGRNAASVRNDPDFDSDMQRLIEQIGKYVPEKPTSNVIVTSTSKPKRRWLKPALAILGGMITLLAALAGIGQFVLQWCSLEGELQSSVCAATTTPSDQLMPTSTATAVPVFEELTSSIVQQSALRVPIATFVDTPKGLTVAPSVHGTAIWGYGETNAVLFAIDPATGEAFSIWSPSELGGDSRAFPLRQNWGERFRPSALHYDGHWLWIGDAGSNRIIALDPTSLEQRAVWNLGGQPINMTSVGDTLWVLLADTGTIVASRFDPDTGIQSHLCEADPIVVGEAPVMLAPDGQSAVWVIYGRGDEGAVRSLSLSSCELNRPLPLNATPTSLAVDQNRLWITAGGDLLSIDLAGDRIPHKVELNISDITHVTLVEERLWLTIGESLYHFDIRAGAIEFQLPLEGTPESVLYYGAQTWVSTSADIIWQFTVPKVVLPGLVDIAVVSETLWMIDEQGRLCSLTHDQVADCFELSLADALPRILAAGSDSFLWLGTDDGGIWHIDLNNRVAERYLTLPYEALTLVEDTGGARLWVANNFLSGLSIIDLSTGDVLDALAFSDNFSVSPPDYIAYDGVTVWFTYNTRQRIIPVRYEDGRLIEAKRGISLSNQTVSDVAATSNGLIVTSPGIVALLNPLTGSPANTWGSIGSVASVAGGNTTLWIANPQNGFVFELDYLP